MSEEIQKPITFPQYPVPKPPPQQAVHNPGILSKLISRRLKPNAGKAKPKPKASRPKVGGRHSGLQRDQNVHITHRRVFNHQR